MKEGVDDTGIQPDSIDEARELLRMTFPSPFRDTYLGGKTVFRNLLYEERGSSLMEAESVVDMLERTGRIEFRKDSQETGYGTWEVR